MQQSNAVLNQKNQLDRINGQTIYRLFFCFFALYALCMTSKAFSSEPIPSSYPPFVLAQTEWKTGQILAISEPFHDPSTFLFEAGTGSRFGHVGMVSVEAEGVFVYEEAPPFAKKTPINIFLKTAEDGRSQKLNVTLLEYAEPLTASKKKQLVQEAQNFVDKKTPYNYNMIVNKNSMNCSEFIYQIFKAAHLKSVGEEVDFKKMNIGAFNGKLMEIARVDENLKGLSVTPASIVNSPHVKVVSTNLPVEQIMSDAEILLAWTTTGALANMLTIFGLPAEAQEMLQQVASDKPYRPYPESWRSPIVKKLAIRKEFSQGSANKTKNRNLFCRPIFI